MYRVLPGATGPGRGPLAAIGLVEVFFGFAALYWCGVRVTAPPQQSTPAWWLAAVLLAGVGLLAAGALLLARRRASPAAVLWTQHAAVGSLVPAFLLGSVTAVWTARLLRSSTEPVVVAAALRGFGICLAAGVLAASAVAAVRLLRREERGREPDPDEAEDRRDGVLSYATAGRRDGGRVSLTGANLTAIGFAQGVYGTALLWLCGWFIQSASLRLSYYDLLVLAFLAFGSFAGTCNLAAGVVLVLRKRGRSHGPRPTPQRLAAGSLVPLFLVGVVATAHGVHGIYWGNDMFIGYEVILGLVLAFPAALFAVIDLAALRMLRAAIAKPPEPPALDR